MRHLAARECVTMFDVQREKVAAPIARRRALAGRVSTLWTVGVPRMVHPPLTTHTSADVCVVGGGIAGLTTAYLLAREGCRTVVIDAGDSESLRTSAHLSWVLDDGFGALERRFGAAGARLAADSHRWAVDEIERIATDEEIDCDFERVPGYLFTERRDHERALIDEAYAARRAGVTVNTVGNRPTVHGARATLCFPDQGQCHPGLYLRGLAESAQRAGVRLYSGRAVEAGTLGVSRVRTTTGVRVSCGAVVLATNAPVHASPMLHARQTAYRSYLVGLRIPAGSVPRALYWDTADPYHYARVVAMADDGGDILLVGGADHRTGTRSRIDDPYAYLAEWARSRWADVGDTVWQWSGQVREPADMLGFAGRLGGENAPWVITGDSGHGLTHGTLGARIVVDAMMRRENVWAALYSPTRSAVRDVPRIARRALPVVAAYCGHLLPGEVEDVTHLAPGDGAVVRRGVHTHAVFRDESGGLHELSAVCSHWGGIVRWNAIEKTWDCPCHGSRFSIHGEVLHGPATAPLDATDSGLLPEVRSASRTSVRRFASPTTAVIGYGTGD
jgi:glycine/D-amino acid oxidase-like deaminating enzyme/nitrite reductase/ring-hydroxylating ferredoxin subunit